MEAALTFAELFPEVSFFQIQLRTADKSGCRLKEEISTADLLRKLPDLFERFGKNHHFWIRPVCNRIVFLDLDNVAEAALQAVYALGPRAVVSTSGSCKQAWFMLAPSAAAA